MSHVLRLAKKLLPKNSPIEATLKLREIALGLKNISADNEKEQWQEKIAQWEKQYSYLLKEKTVGSPENKKKWWYTHGNLRRGFRLLTHEQEPFFIHLANPIIRHSNNSLEGVNSQLKQKLGSHRGMKTQQQVSFLSWYLTFKRIKNHQDLKKLWDMWKSEILSDLPTRNFT